MTESRDDLIKGLVASLRPVTTPGDTKRPLAWWLATAGAYGVAIVLATGGWRAGALASLRTSGDLVIETLLGIAAIAMLAHAALRSAVPDAESEWRRFSWPLAILGAWAAFHLLGLWQTNGPPSMLGKREHCFWQGLLFALPSFALLLWWVRGLMPLRPRISAAAAGAAAAALPALLMQFACMYDPLHALSYHMTPIAALAVAGASIGHIVMERRPRTRPRSGTLH
jgi:hypothetical protein